MDMFSSKQRKKKAQTDSEVRHGYASDKPGQFFSSGGHTSTQIKDFIREKIQSP